MTAFLRSLLLALFVGTALIQNCGCNKATDSVPSAVAVKTNPPAGLDSSAKASRNCVDSMVGVYYGRGYRYEEIDPFGGPRQQYASDGPDTLWVEKNGTNGLCVHSNRIARYDCFTFDSSQTMHNNSSRYSYETGEASLGFISAKDSVQYSYRYETPDHGILASFAGVK